MKWTNKDVARLKQMFADATNDELEQAFYPRSWKSIERRGYELKLKRSRCRNWLAIAKQHQPVIFCGPK